jgi:hypothetical protein
MRFALSDVQQTVQVVSFFLRFYKGRPTVGTLRAHFMGGPPIPLPGLVSIVISSFYIEKHFFYTC